MAEKNAKEHKQESDAIRDVFEEFLNDYYKHRRKIFYMNFVRGIWFGFGSVLGGTIIITLLLWVLSWFQQVPFLTDVIQNIQHALQSR
jgi:hypothetical protein